MPAEDGSGLGRANVSTSFGVRVTVRYVRLSRAGVSGNRTPEHSDSSLMPWLGSTTNMTWLKGLLKRAPHNPMSIGNTKVVPIGPEKSVLTMLIVEIVVEG